jgi:hypothetical protein
MNFKVIAAVGVLAVGARAEVHIRLLEPRSFHAPGGEVALQGTVDLPGVGRLDVNVQPLAASGAAPGQTAAVDVVDGLFQGRVALYPGLNIVELRTPGKGVEARFAFYHPSPAAEKNWGESSPVVFTRPEGYMVDQPEVEVEGVVADPTAREVTLIVLGQSHFQVIQGYADAVLESPGLLPVVTAPVKDLRFKSRLPLAPGHNVILARVGRRPTTPSAVAVIGLAREERHPKLILDEPEFTAENVVIVQGRADRSLRGSGEVRLSAMVRPAGAKRLAPLEITTRVQPDAQGHFLARLPLGADVAKTLRVLPLVQVSLGRARASRLLIQGLPERTP